MTRRRSDTLAAEPQDAAAWVARLGSDQIALLRRIKTAFDPAGILNPGKLGS